jgi:hypothetical protein
MEKVKDLFFSRMGLGGLNMDEWKLEIKKVNNGYILKGKFGDSDIVSEQVIEENGDDIYSTDEMMSSNLNAIQNVLYEVMEYFGVYYSDHNKRNLKIEIEENNE